MPFAPAPTKSQQETDNNTEGHEETDIQRASRLIAVIVEDDPTVRNCTASEARKMIHGWLGPIVARARDDRHGSTSIRHHEMFRDELRRPIRRFEIFRAAVLPSGHSEPDSAHAAIEAFVLKADEARLLYTCSDDPDHPWARVTLIKGD